MSTKENRRAGDAAAPDSEKPKLANPNRHVTETQAPPADDPRRQGRVVVVFKGEKSTTGALFVAGETWGAVEWSEKRGVWCIEDAEGRCLRHASSIHGKAAAKEEAIALAERMVRDGTLPSPQDAADLHREAKQREREKRAKRPSEIRRAQEREERKRLSAAASDAYWTEYKATPFYEIFAEAFDLADPDLWKSNSFAMVRPRLLVEVRAAAARLEHELYDWRTKYRKPNPKLERSLARTRKILALLDDEAAP
jgi:hypothetical protein